MEIDSYDLVLTLSKYIQDGNTIQQILSDLKVDYYEYDFVSALGQYVESSGCFASIGAERPMYRLNDIDETVIFNGDELIVKSNSPFSRNFIATCYRKYFLDSGFKVVRGSDILVHPDYAWELVEYLAPEYGVDADDDDALENLYNELIGD